MSTPNHNSRRTSDALEALIVDAGGDGKITIQEIMRMLGDRAFGLAILVFSLPNSLPIPSPPGFSAITGIPIILIALQMVVGRSTPWLPPRIRRYGFSRDTFARFLAASLPYIRKVERLLHPRLAFMHSYAGERVVGAVFLVLAAVLSLPIPFGNFLPGVSMSIIALGLLERDGALMLAGMALGALAVLLIFTVVDVVATAALHALFSVF